MAARFPDRVDKWSQRRNSRENIRGTFWFFIARSLSGENKNVSFFSPRTT